MLRLATLSNMLIETSDTQKSIEILYENVSNLLFSRKSRSVFHTFHEISYFFIIFF